MDPLISQLSTLTPLSVNGTVTGVSGLIIRARGINTFLTIGARCAVRTRHGSSCLCEVVGFEDTAALLMPFEPIHGIGPGCEVTLQEEGTIVAPHESWLGRLVSGVGMTADDGPPLIAGDTAIGLHNAPPRANRRGKVMGKIELGVRSINTFVTCCHGQRLGIFSGSGVGKSLLISMLARFTKADVNVIGLIGERGREVTEFINETLGVEGMRNSVVVVATADQTPLMRRQAAYMTLAIAEYFRDQGRQVLCVIDSLTRFAMAQREIGLSAGEPPTSKGYPPSAFTELAGLLERAGPGEVAPDGTYGSITGLFSVLVEGDDFNEPIADAVRSIVDGHVVLRREIAHRGRYPSVDVLQSVSRTLPDCNTAQENALIAQARQYLTDYENMAELIRLGAYRKGSDPRIDKAIKLYEPLEAFLAQAKDQPSTLQEGYQQLAEILAAADTPAAAAPSPPESPPETP
ncbi:MAG: flagellar protein export ATPase FliI [Pseudomonadota bacterium]